MTEAEVNGIVSSSLTWAWKIPDGPHLKGYNPFDGFGIFKAEGSADGIPVYWESKNLKKPQAFNFNDLQDHQINNLLMCKRLHSQSLTLFLICVDYGRRDKRLFVFRDMEYIFNRKASKKSILKKEFNIRKNFILIKNKHIDFNEIINMPVEWEYVEG